MVRAPNARVCACGGAPVPLRGSRARWIRDLRRRRRRHRRVLGARAYLLTRARYARTPATTVTSIQSPMPFRAPTGRHPPTHRFRARGAHARRRTHTERARTHRCRRNGTPVRVINCEERRRRRRCRTVPNGRRYDQYPLLSLCTFLRVCTCLNMYFEFICVAYVRVFVCRCVTESRAKYVCRL